MRVLGADPERANEDREVHFAVRSLPAEKADALDEALERLRHGDCGICREGTTVIAPGRLRVMPEGTTCVRCQDRLERMSNRLALVGTGV